MASTMASRLLPVLALQPAGVEATLTLSTFAPIGYTDNGVAPNFVRVEYDADASPLELRMSASGDEPSFFDALAARLGELSAANGGAAVVLVGHSVSNCVASSFLRWAAATKGRAWVDGAVYSWVAFAAPLLGTAECARRLLKGEVAATAAPESSVVTKVAPPAASAAIAALDRSAPSAAWLVPRGAWARRTSLGAFWLRDESVLRIQIGKVEVQRWAVVHKPTGRDTGDGPALYLEVDVNGSRIACAPTKSYEPVFNFAVQSVLLSQGGAGVEDVAPNVVTIILKKRTTVGSSTVATAVLDLAALLGPSIAATSGPAGAVAAGAAVTLTAGDGAEETASAAALAGSGLAAVVGLSSPARGASLSPRAGERGAFADGGADAASPAEGDADVATEGIADGALAYNSAAYEGLVAFEGLAIRKQAYGSQQAVAPATMRLSLAWRRSASGDTEQHVRPSLWASLDEATSTTSVTANPRTSDVVARFSGPSYLADPAFGGIPATAIPRGREINRREERSLKPMATECLETQVRCLVAACLARLFAFSHRSRSSPSPSPLPPPPDSQFALAESDVAPPPLKRVVAVYGVNTPTAVQYAFKHKHMHALRTPGVLPWEPSTSLDGVSGDGVVYESEACGRLALRVDTGERVATSGDGVVPYLSLRHAASWHGARALGARELCNVQVLELPGASHDDVVSDARAAAFLARYLAPTISVEVPASELLGAHAAGRKAEQLYLTLTLLDAEGEALEPAVRSSLATAGALPSEPIVVGGYCDVETATSMTLELCSRVSSVPLASVSLDVAEVLYRTNTPTLTAWEAWHDLDVRSRARSRRALLALPVRCCRRTARSPANALAFLPVSSVSHLSPAPAPPPARGGARRAADGWRGDGRWTPSAARYIRRARREQRRALGEKARQLVRDGRCIDPGNRQRADDPDGCSRGL
jgi:hypothetical protein